MKKTLIGPGEHASIAAAMHILALSAITRAKVCAVDLVRDVADQLERETTSVAPGAARKSRGPRKARR